MLKLHRGDFFATGMGKTVCDILTRECMRGRFRFDGDNPNLVKYVTRWGEDNDLSGIVGKGFDLSSRMGNAILRLNIVAGTGEIYPSIHGINRTYFEVNRREEIVKAKFLDYLSANTTQLVASTTRLRTGCGRTMRHIIGYASITKAARSQVRRSSSVQTTSKRSIFARSPNLRTCTAILSWTRGINCHTRRLAVTTGKLMRSTRR